MKTINEQKQKSGRYENYYKKFTGDVDEYLRKYGFAQDAHPGILEKITEELFREIEKGSLSITKDSQSSFLHDPSKNNPVFAFHKNFVFFNRHYRSLENISRKLKEFRNFSYCDAITKKKKDIEDYFTKLPVSLDENQERAILLSLCLPFLIISGGPGTGKTTIAAHIVGVHLYAGLVRDDEIAIAAPTGRAAGRFKESIGEQLKGIVDVSYIEPMTIHRLLRFEPYKSRFFYNENNKLRYKLYIIDETSMLSLFLMENFLLALPDIRKQGIKLVFLGDKDQLPSVEEGNILETLIEGSEKIFDNTTGREEKEKLISEVGSMMENNHHKKTVSSLENINVIYLEKNYRIKNVSEGYAEIYELIKSIRDGTLTDRMLNKYSADTNNEASVIWYDTNDKEEIFKIIFDFLDEMYRGLDSKEKMTPEHLYNRLINEYKILVPTRVGELGVDGIHERIKAETGKKAHSGFSKFFEDFYPIIITENDYYNELFNGDLGLVFAENNQNKNESREGKKYSVYFRKDEDNKLREYSLLSLKKYELAFVSTIHKSQGSEYDTVMVVFPPVENNENVNEIMNRKLLYTAVTRAKKKLRIVGSWATMEKVVKNNPVRITGFDIWA